MFSANDRVLVYPVDRESLALIKSTENYINVYIQRLISPVSWGHEGEKHKCSSGLVEVSCDYEDSLDDCTAVLIVDSWNKLDFKKFIKPAITIAHEKGKRIVCSRSLTASEKTEISNFDVAYVELSLFSSPISPDDRVNETSAPVISVMSSTEYCNQLYIETALCTELRKRGYKTLLISSQKEGAILGEYTIPNFMFSSSYNENDKVLAMNNYVCNLESIHQPDIIIIGIPGAAMSYDYQYSSDFGILAYEISEAIKSDFSILSSPCMPYDVEFFKKVEKVIYGRLGTYIDIHSLSPYTIDSTSSEKNLSYLSVDEIYISDIIYRLGYDKLMNLNSMNGILLAFSKIVDKFTDNMSSLIT